MKSKKISFYSILITALMVLVLLSLNPLTVFADALDNSLDTTEAINDVVPVEDPTTTEPLKDITNTIPVIAQPVEKADLTQPAGESNTAENSTVESFVTTDTYVAELTIYSSSSSSGSSYSIDGHSYVSIKNLSSSNIQIGLLTGIAPGKMVSLGTWGNKSEHTGLWYNLEAYFTYYSNPYTGNASISMNLTAAQLNTINNYIINHDTWTVGNNCSVWAANLWNEVNSVWFIGGTPTFLKTQISERSGSVIGKTLSYNYIVYYAQGTSTPQPSQEWD